MTKTAALETQAKNILDRRNSNFPDPEVRWYLCLRDGKDYCGCGLVHVKVKGSLKGCEDPGHTNLWSFFFPKYFNLPVTEGTDGLSGVAGTQGQLCCLSPHTKHFFSETFIQTNSENNFSSSQCETGLESV